MKPGQRIGYSTIVEPPPCRLSRGGGALPGLPNREDLAKIHNGAAMKKLLATMPAPPDEPAPGRWIRQARNDIKTA